MRETRVRRRLSRILKEVKSECGDGNASSDDDGQSVFNSNKMISVKLMFSKLPIIIIIIFYACRHIIVDSRTAITFLSDTHRLAQSSSQPLHTRHED